MADRIFEEPRMAQVADAIDGARSDLAVYSAIVTEFSARSVLDIGCGTGTLACMLALRGIAVTAVDPAEASLGVARAKPGADRVAWLRGTAENLPESLDVDLAFMTGNVAQVFLTDEEWEATLRGARAALRPGGRLIFETRDPSQRAWEGWTPEQSRGHEDIPGVGMVRFWSELMEVHEELVTFKWTVAFDRDGAVFESESTLRFRNRETTESSLRSAGLLLDEVRDAPDRPGLEFVFIARRPG